MELGSLPFVRTSPGRLEQVFVNVLINAAQSFELEGVSGNVVRIRVTQGRGEVTITIEDNGRGISAEHLPRVFDPFFTTKPAGEGTGLGLSICHAIVTQHGGRIDVSSALDRGTTVSIVLRTEDSPSVEAADAREPAPRSSRRARVLVVDDEVALGRLLCEILTPAHEVTVATSGSEAETLLLRTDQPFDVVLCDLTMPDLSGEALFERVCTAKPELRRRFVFMTGGLFTSETLHRLGTSGAPRLEKPFSRAEAIAVIEQIVGTTG
jgi:CheY-like chemotaxis protein